MQIKLLVIRTNDQKRLVDFYKLFGLTFEYHQHNNSPFHYSTTIENLVLEIYPLTKNQTETDKSLRLGFEVDNFEEILETLKENNILFSIPTQTEFGFLSVITDRYIKLTQTYTFVVYFMFQRVPLPSDSGFLTLHCAI